MITCWEGVPITELSRDKLIEALEFYASEYWANNTPDMMCARSLGHVEMIKRGEKI